MSTTFNEQQKQHSSPFIIIQPQYNYSRLTLNKHNNSNSNSSRRLKTAKQRHKVYNSYDSKSPRIADPNHWDCRLSKPFNSNYNSNTSSMYLTGINYAQENNKQQLFILQDFSRYKKQPESYLPKYEIDKLFLEKISTPLKVSKSHNKLKPMKSQLCYNLNKHLLQQQQQPRTQPHIYNNINSFSRCDVNYLKNTNPHILKMKRIQDEFYKLRKNKPLAIVPGVYAIKKLTKAIDNESSSLKPLIHHHYNKQSITNSTCSESTTTFKNATVQTN